MFEQNKANVIGQKFGEGLEKGYFPLISSNFFYSKEQIGGSQNNKSHFLKISYKIFLQKRISGFLS